MDEESFNVRLVGEAAKVVTRYAEQDASSKGEIVGQCISTYQIVKESLWDGGTICIRYEDGRETQRIVFPFAPPTMAVGRESFINRLANSPVWLGTLFVSTWWGALLIMISVMFFGQQGEGGAVLVNVTTLSFVNITMIFLIWASFVIINRRSPNKHDVQEQSS